MYFLVGSFGKAMVSLQEANMAQNKAVSPTPFYHVTTTWKVALYPATNYLRIQLLGVKQSVRQASIMTH